MIPYSSYEFAKYRIHDNQSRAAALRFRRAVRTRTAGTYATPVIDSIGHGLIAIGSRLVSDRPEPPNHRRAA